VGTGRYEGRAVVELLDDGRLVRLRQPIAYIDPHEVRWDVPKGAEVDGASIPRVLWTFIGGPFEGKYRKASIIHDWYCDIRSRPWRQVHRMFFDAMIASSVPMALAKPMYAGVYFGGPRWSETVVHNVEIRKPLARPSGPLRRGGPKHARWVFERGYLLSRERVADTWLTKYRIEDSDLNWLTGQMHGRHIGLDSIDHAVDERLKERSPDRNLIRRSVRERE